jgi:hypothetical protein
MAVLNLTAYYSYCSLSQSDIQTGGSVTNTRPYTGNYSYGDGAKIAPDFNDH